MNALDALVTRLSTAAQKPPSLPTHHKVRSVARQVYAMSARDSTGRARPIVRQSLAQQQALEEQARVNAVAEAKADLIAQARQALT